MKRKHITEKPFLELCSREWKRAKRLLPMLKARQRPFMKWADWKTLDGAHGMCYREANIIYVHHKFQLLSNHKEFVLLLRHEFAHLLKVSPGQACHGKDFKYWSERLGATRWTHVNGFKED